MSVLPKIVWPIPSSRRGSEFKNQEEILSHLGGESTGLYMIGRSGMWHVAWWDPYHRSHDTMVCA